MNILHKYKKLVRKTLLLSLLTLPMTACFDHARTLKVRLIASKDINENAYYMPSPLVIHLYELKSNKAFYKAQAEQLFLHEDDTLGDSLVHSKSFFIKPSMSYIFQIKFEDNSENLSMASEFYNIADKSSHWKYNVSLQDSNTDIQLYIYKQKILSAKEYNALINNDKKGGILDKAKKNSSKVDSSKLKPPTGKAPKINAPKIPHNNLMK